MNITTDSFVTPKVRSKKRGRCGYTSSNIIVSDNNIIKYPKHTMLYLSYYIYNNQSNKVDFSDLSQLASIYDNTNMAQGLKGDICTLLYTNSEDAKKKLLKKKETLCAINETNIGYINIKSVKELKYSMGSSINDNKENSMSITTSIPEKVKIIELKLKQSIKLLDIESISIFRNKLNKYNYQTIENLLNEHQLYGYIIKSKQQLYIYDAINILQLIDDDKKIGKKQTLLTDLFIQMKLK